MLCDVTSWNITINLKSVIGENMCYKIDSVKKIKINESWFFFEPAFYMEIE